MDPFATHYDERSFWEKAKKFARRAGRNVIQSALILYHCLQDSDTPQWAKTVILGALGYFIFPADAIPDLTPVVGFADDLGALTAAAGIVAMHIKPEHHERARRKILEWFGEEADENRDG